MKQDEIIEMARQVGLHIATDVNWMPIIGIEYAEAFAKLVAAHTLMNIDPSKFIGGYQEGYEAGAAHEREECANIAMKYEPIERHRDVTYASDAIRARSKA